jgi:tricorn protease
MALGWTPDGKSILFNSTRATAFPANPEVYAISVEGGSENKQPFVEAKEVAYSPRNNLVAFTRGPGTWYRKNYRGSSNDDLFLARPDGTEVRKISSFDGQDGAPMWAPHGRRLYYVSEQFNGPANIVFVELDDAGRTVGSLQRLTRHADDAVRRARISGNGEWIVYECGGDLWLVSARDGQSRKLAIEVHADEKSNGERLAAYTKDVTEYALSPDDNHVAFIVHGEIFLMPAKGGKATRLTNTPAVEHGIAWSHDGKSLLFAADRNGQEDLYLLEPDDPEHPELTKAHRFKTRQLTNTPEAEVGASFAPEGGRILFLRGGKLWSMKPDGAEQKVLVDQQQVFDYDWSPDGKWIVYARSDGSFASELYLMPLDGAERARNVTRYATHNGDVSWNNSGNKIAFLSQRRGTHSMHVMSLQKPAASGGSTANPPAANAIDWDDIHLRVERPGNNLASEGTISRNGRWIAYRSFFNGSDDLWLVSVDGFVMQRLSTGSAQPRLIRWQKNSQAVWFLDGNGALRNAPLGPGGIPASATPPTAPNTVNFTARMIINRDEEFAQMFEQSWRALSHHFYDAAHHGIDWRAIREKYRALVPHVAMKEDLYSLISLMLGELNASHLGITGQTKPPEEVTADLGLLFDAAFAGPGLKITEVLKRGPADKRNLALKPGDIILAIDRTELTPRTNVSQLLNAKVGEMVLLDVASDPADAKTRRRVEIQGASRSTISDLMYHRWVDQNARLVAEQSKGTLGYIHIPSMDDAGLEQFVRSLYSDNFDKDAIIIDVRFNGGGFTHDQVLNYLGAKEHTFFRQRDGGEGLVLRSYDRKWTKPAAVMINNRSYSDAEIFPSAFKTLGLGKVIGQATGGFVIGTTQIRLIDGSSFRTPRTGVFTVKGVNMEKQGVLPDIAVDAVPEDMAKGIDAQLNKAVETLTRDVVEWKKARGSLAVGSSGGAPPVPPMTTPAPK